MSDMNPWGTYMMTEHIMDGMNTSKLMFTSALKIEEAAVDLGSICKLFAVFILEECPDLQMELSKTPFPDEGKLPWHGECPDAIVRVIKHDHIVLDVACPELWQRFVDSIMEVAKGKFNAKAVIIGNRVDLRLDKNS